MIVLFTPKEGIIHATISWSFNPNFMPVVMSFIISFLIIIVRICNNLPYDSVSATSLHVFKKRLRKIDLHAVNYHIY